MGNIVQSKTNTNQSDTVLRHLTKQNKGYVINIKILKEKKISMQKKKRE